MAVKMFTGTRRIDGLLYSVNIPATSWDEAREIGTKVGITIDGELVEERSVGLCAMCQEPQSVKSFENLQPVEATEEWPEIIEENL